MAAPPLYLALRLLKTPGRDPRDLLELLAQLAGQLLGLPNTGLQLYWLSLDSAPVDGFGSPPSQLEQPPALATQPDRLGQPAWWAIRSTTAGAVGLVLYCNETPNPGASTPALWRALAEAATHGFEHRATLRAGAETLRVAPGARVRAAAWSLPIGEELFLTAVDPRPQPREQLELLASSGGLTSREVQIAWQAASGSSNSEISHALRISTETVKAHLASVYRKLNLRGRNQLAARVFGMVP